VSSRGTSWRLRRSLLEPADDDFGLDPAGERDGDHGIVNLHVLAADDMAGDYVAGCEKGMAAVEADA
jgi:hypothetical protein